MNGFRAVTRALRKRREAAERISRETIFDTYTCEIVLMRFNGDEQATRAELNRMASMGVG